MLCVCLVLCVRANGVCSCGCCVFVLVCCLFALVMFVCVGGCLFVLVLVVFCWCYVFVLVLCVCVGVGVCVLVRCVWFGVV